MTASATSCPLPIVHWLRERRGPIDRFNQSLLVQAPAAATADTLGRRAAGRRRSPRRPPDAPPRRPEVAVGVAHRGGAPPARSTPPPCCARVDLTRLGTAARRARHRRGVRSAAAGRLDPGAGAVAAGGVVRRRARRRRAGCCVVAHHLVVDGVSWNVLIGDLATAWAAIDRGEVPDARPGAHVAAALVPRWWPTRPGSPPPRRSRPLAGDPRPAGAGSAGTASGRCAAVGDPATMGTARRR